MEEVADLGEGGAEAAGVVEVFHEVLTGWAEVGDDRGAARDAVEVFEDEGNAGAAGHGDDVDDGVGAAAEGHEGSDRIFERGHREDVRRAEIGPDQIDDLAAAGGGHAGMGGVDGGDIRGTGEGETEGFGDAHHGGGRAHGHAGAGAAGDAVFEFGPAITIEVSGAAFVPVFPDIRAGSESGAAPASPHHGPGRKVDAGEVHGDGTHEEGRGGFVASAHEDRAVERVAAEDFLDLHGDQIAEHHGSGLHEHLAEGRHGNLEREAAGLPDAAFHFLGPFAEVGVAGGEITPCVEDADDWFSGEVGCAVSHLFGAGAMAERAEVIWTEPAVRAEIVREQAPFHEVGMMGWLVCWCNAGMRVGERDSKLVSVDCS